MTNKDDDKVIVKLKKEYLSSERQENKYKSLCLILTIFLVASFAVIAFLCFGIGSNLVGGDKTSDKINEIKNIINGQWVYGNEFENLDHDMDEQMFYGLTYFENDPYTTYMSADDMDYFSSSIDKIQLGIGVSYYMEYDGYPYILKVYKDSGAYNGGIKKGDRIISIDGHSAFNITDEQIKEYILGDEGTFVKIGIKRGDEELILDCERKTFDSTASAELKDDVVVLTIASFGTDTAHTVANELKDYTNYHKLIIDLRDNTGGYQDSLLEVAGLFLKNNTLVMKEIDKNERVTEYYAKFGDHFYNFDHIMIIMNENTASAAEVFAICMKEQHNDTTLVGHESFGKGVVQTSYKLSDGSYLKVTISYWTSPNGVPLNDGGIKPDIEIPLDDAYYCDKYVFEDGEEYAYDSISSYVKCSQLILKYLEYPVGRTDGYFDEEFEEALNMFKKDQQLEPNGILDKITYEKVLDSFFETTKDEQLNETLRLINK